MSYIVKAGSYRSGFGIIGGKVVTPEEQQNFKYTASLIKVNKTDEVLVCSATILTATKIITAAHCIVNFQHEVDHHFYVRAGSLNGSAEGETRKINQIFIHPEYTEADDNNDICVLLLEKELPFNTIIGGIRVANADDENIYAKAGVNLTISAYGLNFLGPIMFDLLMKIQLPIYDWEECVSHFKKTDEIVTKNMFCYGGIEETRYTYDGDSGGK